ncbi:[PSI+] induction protein 2 [Candida viswanathii]|uniref:[PSI+] induction protein 2 n=1 Tax=Candida viswanathii TaxID=5486 RepID=A0A367XYS9_9ASCO|nr:[PSI+] induction protein 2 [Candida viswanathii]
MLLYDFKRDIVDTVSNTSNSVNSFANSFRSFDTCMANTGCKVIFIIGCVLAGFLVIWILTTIFQCLFMGAKCIEACCCCCCRGNNNGQTTVVYEKPPQTYVNPNMYPPQYDQRYAYQPQPPPLSAYPGYNRSVSSPSEYSYTRSDGYQPVAGYAHKSDPFSDRHKN